MPELRVIGPGRAGRSLAHALEAAGWHVHAPLGRDADPAALADAASGCDLLVLAVPDASVADVAQAVRPGEAVVAHLAGALGLHALAPHERRAAIHPLVALPDAEVGAHRLRSGAWFAIAGSGDGALDLAEQVVSDLRGHPIAVADADRAAYHAAAAIASNHLVALLGQVARVAERVGVPLAAYLDLVRATVDNVDALGPEAALTGPVSRGDWDTVGRHLDALGPSERATYLALAAEAARLAGRTLPEPHEAVATEGGR